MASRGTYTFAMPANVSPPVDLASYSRSMHSHTKRQMEAANISPSRRRGHSQQSPMSALHNGTSTSLSGPVRAITPTHQYS
ncbi:hypothetical protein GGS21DRAFT_496313 [Xylaria nigripes]|nr:hypothetical protein GGS21DRAFT_496313 [Xylaria nigripes]